MPRAEHRRRALKGGGSAAAAVKPQQAAAIGQTDLGKPCDPSSAGPAPGPDARYPPVAPDSNTSVAGEEDPGAALDP